MDWSTFFTLVVQGMIVFLLAMGCYGAVRSAHRKENEKDVEARRMSGHKAPAQRGMEPKRYLPEDRLQ